MSEQSHEDRGRCMDQEGRILDQHKEGYATFMAKLGTALKGLPEPVRQGGDKADRWAYPLRWRAKPCCPSRQLECF